MDVIDQCNDEVRVEFLVKLRAAISGCDGVTQYLLYSDVIVGSHRRLGSSEL